MKEKQAKNVSNSNHQERSEPVRSRWTPKPEQILILESIFNSGMVNPPKDETVRIRKLLEKFGTVGDANVFYWFQNRRSRSRRRQRQMQAGGQAAGDKIRDGNINLSFPQGQVSNGCGSGLQYIEGSTSANYLSHDSYVSSSSPNSYNFGSSSSCGVPVNGFDNMYSAQMGFSDMDQQGAALYYTPPGTSTMHLGNDGLVTIFINGVPTEVPSGIIDLRLLFGEDAVLVHSSGLPVLTDEYGFLVGGLQHGDSYFLVSRQT